MFLCKYTFLTLLWALKCLVCRVVNAAIECVKMTELSRGIFSVYLVAEIMRIGPIRQKRSDAEVEKITADLTVEL